MDACYKAAHGALRRDIARRIRSSRRSTTPWSAFRKEQILWFRVAENTFDNFMAHGRPVGRRAPRSRTTRPFCTEGPRSAGLFLAPCACCHGFEARLPATCPALSPGVLARLVQHVLQRVGCSCAAPPSLAPAPSASPRGSLSAALPGVGMMISIFGRIDGRGVRLVDHHHLRERDDQRHHDELDDHERAPRPSRSARW